MKIKLIVSVLLSISLFSINAHASEHQERIYLMQIVNQLNAIKPLIIAASLQQPKTNRVQFHYSHYLDEHHKKHNGLTEDLNQIEMSIQNKLNHIPIEPSVLPPIKGDYIIHNKSQN
jgi:RAQPRD family integrative conjugative element protein